ncbi:MAG: N-acetyltransferase [Anaerolineaceae bacterium]|jgi:putative acetyltransferase
MPMPVFTIRPETPKDSNVISELTVAAFRPLNFPDLNEHFIIEALRAVGALTISLVAEMDGRVVGHIAFSPITISDGTTGWYGLGPVSILPENQRQGIGKALIGEGLVRLKEIGARGCFLVGHPDYYGKVGFVHPTTLTHEGISLKYLFAIAFDGIYPEGEVSFHEAFKATSSPSQ